MPVPPSELREVVTQRGDFLEELVGETRRKPDLSEALAVSRSTVDRALRSLEEAGLVTRVDGGFTATVSGRLAARAYTEYCEQMETLAETGGLLENLDPECDPPQAMLRGADVMLARQPAPYRPATELESFLHDADRVLGLSRSISSSSTSELLARRVQEGMEYEVVYDTTLAEFLARGRGSERAEMVDTGRFEAYATDGLPYGLFVFEREEGTVAALVVYDDSDDLRGVLVNDREEAVEWARERWRSVRDEAMPVTETFARADTSETPREVVDTGDADSGG